MSDIEFDRLIDSVKELREVSTPGKKYFEQVEHFMEFTDEMETAYEYNIETHLDDINNLESVLAA